MAKLIKNKVVPELIIVEGFWRVGKSLLVNNLAKELNYNIVKEPNHLLYRFIRNPHSWYLKQHLSRHKKTADILSNNKRVVMERSIISNVAFEYAKNGKISKKSTQLLQSMPQLNHSIIFFLYGKNGFIKHVSDKIKDESVRVFLIKNDVFYKRYLKFYKTVLNNIIKNKVFCIDVSNGNDYMDKDTFMKVFNDSLDEIRKTAKKEYCVSAVIKYKNKFLALYDKNWRHYVLPQGHVEKNEAETKTLKREIEEETGYTNFNILAKLKAYEYSYLKGGGIIFKKIQPYLIELENLSRVKKRLQIHENYENGFYDYKTINKILRWEADKILMKDIKIKKNTPK